MLPTDFAQSFDLSGFLMRRLLPVALTLYLWMGLVNALRLTHLPL
ncbi:MAG: hypothetical protein ACOVOE_17070 [Caulobacter sp.]